MQHCDFPAELLVAYGDGFLVESRRALVGEHLQTCLHCCERMVAFAEVDNLIRVGSPPIDDPAARTAIITRIEEMRPTLRNGRCDPRDAHQLESVGDYVTVHVDDLAVRHATAGRLPQSGAFVEANMVRMVAARAALQRRSLQLDYSIHRCLMLAVGSLLVVLVLVAAVPAILPIVKQAFEQDPGTERIIALELGQEVDLAQTVSNFTVTVKRVYADPNQIVIGYTVSGPPGREFANFHPFNLANTTAPTLTDAQGHQFSHAPISWGAGVEDGIGGYVEVFDATSIVNSPHELSLHLDIPALTAIERVEDGDSMSYPAASSCEPGICRFTVPGPFTFDLAIPFEPGRAADLHEVNVANGETVTLERVATTQTGTRVDLSGAGPNADVTLVVDGETYALRSPGAITSQPSASAVWAYTSSASFVEEEGDWMLVVKLGRSAAGTPEDSGEPGLREFRFYFSLP